MSDRFKSREDLAEKINWEGGIAEAVDYGIKAEDMPEGDTELTELWAEMVDAYKKFDALADKVHGLLGEHGID